MKYLLILMTTIDIWLPLMLLAAPIAWAIFYHQFYKQYKVRKEAEAWARLNVFFAKNAAKYPNAAASFSKAKFWASGEGRETMLNIKKREYEEMQ